jgi:hypothetical protein
MTNKGEPTLSTLFAGGDGIKAQLLNFFPDSFARVGQAPYCIFCVAKSPRAGMSLPPDRKGHFARKTILSGPAGQEWPGVRPLLVSHLNVR